MLRGAKVFLKMSFFNSYFFFRFTLFDYFFGYLPAYGSYFTL